MGRSVDIRVISKRGELRRDIAEAVTRYDYAYRRDPGPCGGGGFQASERRGTGDPKVMRECLGRPMLYYVLDSLHCADIYKIGIVIGFGADRVRSHFGNTYHYAHQDRQTGSGDAVRCAAALYADLSGALLVLCGDSPLITARTIRGILAAQQIYRGNRHASHREAV